MSEPKDKQTKIEDEIEKEAEIEANETIEQMDEQNDVTEIDQKLAELEEKLEASENRYLRLQADFENVKKTHNF